MEEFCHRGCQTDKDGMKMKVKKIREMEEVSSPLYLYFKLTKLKPDNI